MENLILILALALLVVNVCVLWASRWISGRAKRNLEMMSETDKLVVGQLETLKQQIQLEQDTLDAFRAIVERGEQVVNDLKKPGSGFPWKDTS